MVIGEKLGDGHILPASGAVNRALGLVVLAYCLPLMALVSLAIMSTSGGAVVHRVSRITPQGRQIAEWRFRTTAPHEAGVPLPTAVGRVLRLTRLEMLPQIINVVRGELPVTSLLR